MRDIISEMVNQAMDDYLGGRIEIDVLQCKISDACNLMDSSRGKEFENAMWRLDANIDSIRFTLDDSKQSENVAKVYQEIKTKHFV
jgi:hypothetical protein